MKFVLLLSPALVSLLVMLPRLLSPQFGLFDDANTLVKLDRIAVGTWSLTDEAPSGRFRPLFWTYYFLIYMLGGRDPLPFFLGNTLLLMGITAFVILIVRRNNGSWLQAWFAGLLFALAGPVIENGYTLSKGELLQIFWISLAILLSTRSDPSASLRKSTGLLLLVSFVLFIALCSKETTLVILPITLGWFLFALIRRRLGQPDSGEDVHRRKLLFLAVVISTLSYLTWRFYWLPFGFNEAGYSGRYMINSEQIITSLKVWLDWINRDFVYLLPLLIVPAILALRKRFLPQAGLLFDAALWTIGWLIFFLPWEFQAEYYLLPFSVGSSILGGILAGQILEVISSPSKIIRGLALLTLALSSLLLLFTIPNNITQARLQLIIDKTNDEAIDYIVENLPIDSMILVNLQYINQYVWDLETYFHEIYDREDISVTIFQFQEIEELDTNHSFLYILSPHFVNQYHPSIRLGVFEHYMKEWNPSMLEYIGEDYEIVFKVKRTLQLALVDSARILCPILPPIMYCKVPNTPFDHRILEYGWTLYNIPISAES